MRALGLAGPELAPVDAPSVQFPVVAERLFELGEREARGEAADFELEARRGRFGGWRGAGGGGDGEHAAPTAGGGGGGVGGFLEDFGGHCGGMPDRKEGECGWVECLEEVGVVVM